MIQLYSAGKRFGPKLLFENLDWLITTRARVGIVGANGTGKTTLITALAMDDIQPLGYCFSGVGRCLRVRSAGY